MLSALMSFILSAIQTIYALVPQMQGADFSPFLSAVLGALPIIVIIGIVGLIMKSLDKGM